MNRREWFGSLALGAAALSPSQAQGSGESPEKKSPTEPLDLERKAADTLDGKRPYDPLSYPYFSPDYKLPFTHIGVERQLFLDNFMLEYLEGVKRVLTPPEKAPKPLIEPTGLPWESSFNPIVVAAVRDPDAGNFKLWYTVSLSGDPYGTGQVLCIAESNDGLTWDKPLSSKGIPYRDQKATNIVHADDVSGAGLVLNHNRSDPSRKFLLIYAPTIEARKKGARTLSRVAASPDGWKWNVISSDVDQRHQHESRIIWDESIQRWVAYGQYSHHWHYGPRVRQVGRQTSTDLLHWSPKEVVLSPDWDPPTGVRDREFHEGSVQQFGGLYIAIVGVAHSEPIWNSRTKTLRRDVCRATVWRDQFHVNMALYVSRDGRRFTRAHGPEPWVDNGPYGSQDYGYCATPVRMASHEGQDDYPVRRHSGEAMDDAAGGLEAGSGGGAREVRARRGGCQ